MPARRSLPRPGHEDAHTSIDLDVVVTAPRNASHFAMARRVEMRRRETGTMSDNLIHVHGTAVLLYAQDGSKFATERDAADVIGEAQSAGATLVVMPVERLEDDFFQLRTRIAGEIVQKLVNYRLRLAIVGDISRHLEMSAALRDFVYECNQGNQIWFLPDLSALRERLAQESHCPTQ